MQQKLFKLTICREENAPGLGKAQKKSKTKENYLEVLKKYDIMTLLTPLRATFYEISNTKQRH